MLRRSSLVLVLAFALMACISEDPGPSQTGADAGAVNPGADAGAVNPDAGAVDAAPVPPGSAANRKINCDAVASCTGADLCCGVGMDWIGSSCKKDCAGAYFLFCDDASDCATDQICCATTDGGARAKASYCATGCRPPAENEMQLCSLTSPGECKTGSCSPLSEFSPSGLASCR